MTNIVDVLDPEELLALEKAGRIKVTIHPEYDLFIHNYTNKAQFENEWTNAERMCRGLITDHRGKIIARGMPKFFNYGDARIGEEVTDDTIVEAYTKWDGSLGICYVQPDGQVAVATRGSFTSEQALIATSYLRDGQQRVNASHVHEAAEYGRTILVEIIYPENKVVVDYGETRMLRLLGWVDNQTGGFEPSHSNLRFTGPLYQLMKLGVQTNEEGFVCQTRTGNLFKVKSEEYKTLHRLIFGISNKSIWEVFAHGGYARYEELRKQLPESVGVWADRVYVKLTIQEKKLNSRVATAIHTFTQDSPDRKTLALRLQEHAPDLLPFVFTAIDKGPEALRSLIRKAIKPEKFEPYATAPKED